MVTPKNALAEADIRNGHSRRIHRGRDTERGTPLRSTSGQPEPLPRCRRRKLLVGTDSFSSSAPRVADPAKGDAASVTAGAQVERSSLALPPDRRGLRDGGRRSRWLRVGGRGEHRTHRRKPAPARQLPARGADARKRRTAAPANFAAPGRL
jgi:hypothetical protein